MKPQQSKMQGRNTKKLSLELGDSKETVINSNEMVNAIEPVATAIRKPALVHRRSSASIYSKSNMIRTNAEVSPSTLVFPVNENKSTNTSPRDLKFPNQQGNRKTHSLSLSVNTHMTGSVSRNRSITISNLDTSTPIPESTVSTKNMHFPLRTHIDSIDHPPFPEENHHPQIQEATEFIPSTPQGGKTTWTFPGAHSDITSSLDTTNIYEEVYTKNAYPDGPLLVVPPNIYLYSEPQLKQILDFDLIINVAEEIPNLQYLIPTEFHGKIEYYHVEWSHRSKIVKDLKKLTELMHKATLQHKRILIHCQCGVSRSASLMVAYIMRYCNMSLNDAYNKLKSIAKDISPNMGLIFQLMEWNEELNSIANETSSENKSNLDHDDSSTNDSSISTSEDIQPRTPLDFSKNHADFSALNT